jgi:putative spermidine/putrescine transport system permease protein
MRLKTFVWLCLLPLAVVVLAFFVLPMARLMIVGGSGPQGLANYAAILTEPRYRATLINTVVLAAATTIVSLVVATIAGLFLQRTRFPGRPVLVAMLTFPLAFPGVVVGFMIILLAGRQGLIGDLTLRVFGEKLVFAYTIQGLFLGYLYFSIPRVILTIMAAVEKLDPSLEEAARALGAGPWAVHRDVILPALGPAFVASGAIAFATAMGAFGTAFTLATNIDVLPMLIYTEFTLSANIAIAAALSVGLGLVAWAVLALARSFGGGSVAAAGWQNVLDPGPPDLHGTAAVHAAGGGVPDRARRAVDAGRRHRQLLPRHQLGLHAAVDRAGLGSLRRHDRPLVPDRRRDPRRHAARRHPGGLRAARARRANVACDRGDHHAAAGDPRPRDRAGAAADL